MYVYIYIYILVHSKLCGISTYCIMRARTAISIAIVIATVIADSY